MKVIVFGLGSIGMRHAQILIQGFDCEVYAFRSKRGVPNTLGIKEIYSWDEVKEVGAEVAFITNPTSEHLKTAMQCAELGMQIFLEKPISDRDERLDEFITICRGNNITCYVAYCLRFHPVIQKVRELIKERTLYHVRVCCTSLLHAWRPEQKEKNYSYYKEQGGGVILDLSHEFDYIEYVFGQIRTIRGIYGRAAEVTVDAEDFCDCIITLESGLNVNLHLNFLSYANERTITVDFDDGYLVGDLMKDTVFYKRGEAQKTFKCSMERDTMFVEQTKYFFKNINDQGLMNNIYDASTLLKKILNFKRQALPEDSVGVLKGVN